MATLPAFAKSYANVVNGLLVRFLIKNRFILIIQSLQMMYDYKLRLIIEPYLACQWVVVSSFLVRSFEDRERLHDYAEKICEIENKKYIFIDKSKDFKKMHEKAKRLSENVKEMLNINLKRFKW